MSFFLKKYLSLLILCFLLFLPACGQDQKITLSTYYPCPEGIFAYLLVTEKLNFKKIDPGDVSDPQAGDLIYDADQDSFQYFNKDGEWQDLTISEEIIEEEIKDYFD